MLTVALILIGFVRVLKAKRKNGDEKNRGSKSQAVSKGKEMNQYRLHIDIPLGTTEEDAIANAKSIMLWHFNDKEAREKIQRHLSVF